MTSGTTEITDQYEQLIATFVNQIKEEVEDAHNWRSLRQTITVTLPVGTTSVAIPGTTDRSRLYYDQDQIAGVERPVVVDVTDNEQYIREMDTPRLLLKQQVNPTTTTDNAPSYFAVDDSTADDELVLQVFPATTVERTILVTMIVPQERIGDDELDTVISVPARPIELGAIWYALEERGEELGVNGVFSERKYRTALDDAISRDASAQGGYQLVPV